MLFHTLVFCCQLKFWKLLQWSEWYDATGENRNFEYKEDKATTRILNLNAKTIENKHFIHYLKQFLETLSVCFVIMPTSKLNYQCFLILVQSFSACSFLRIVDCLQYKLSSVWSYIFLLNGPDKKPKQNSSKTKRHSQQQEAKSVGRRTTVNETFLVRCYRDCSLIV